MKLSWNYRVLSRFYRFDEEMAKALNKKGERIFQVMTVYYNDKLEPVSFGDRIVDMSGENVDDIYSDLKKIKKALKEPVLDYDNFPKEYKR